MNLVSVLAEKVVNKEIEYVDAVAIIKKYSQLKAKEDLNEIFSNIRVNFSCN